MRPVIGVSQSTIHERRARGLSTRLCLWWEKHVHCTVPVRSHNSVRLLKDLARCSTTKSPGVPGVSGAPWENFEKQEPISDRPVRRRRSRLFSSIFDSNEVFCLLNCKNAAIGDHVEQQAQQDRILASSVAPTITELKVPLNPGMSIAPAPSAVSPSIAPAHRPSQGWNAPKSGGADSVPPGDEVNPRPTNPGSPQRAAFGLATCLTRKGPILWHYV